MTLHGPNLEALSIEHMEKLSLRLAKMYGTWALKRFEHATYSQY